MSVTSFIPELWSARILQGFNNALVYANLLNRDYEGEIQNYGDTVHITSIGDVTIKTYTKNADIAAPDELATTDQTLVIDQGDYFNFGVDDVDKAQVRDGGRLITEAGQKAAYGFSSKTDKFCAGLLSAGNIKLGKDSDPLVVTADDAYEYMVEMRTQMDKANVPKQGRWIVVPPEFEGFMLLDPRFASAAGTNAEGRLVSGLVARAAGFDIYTSNNVPNSSGKKNKIIASTNAAGTFANQILKTEAYRPEKRFGDAVKGLHVYGAKLLIPDIVAVATVNFEAEKQETPSGGGGGQQQEG